MKNKPLILLPLVIIALGIMACGDGKKETQGASTMEECNAQQESVESGEKGSGDQEIDSDGASEESQERTLEDIEKFMLDNGAVSGERTQMAAEMVGGVGGFKYADSGVEVYEYDVNSKEYISLSNGEEIPLQGMDGFTVGATSINGKFVLMGEPSQEVIDIFNSFE